MSKSGHWVTAQIEDVDIKYTYEKHSPTVMKGIPWLYCKHCGLIYLRNRITQWCVKMGCNNEYHPEYKVMLKKLAGRYGQMGKQNVNSK